MAQSVDDFRSHQAGNWNATTTWERWDGSTWVTAAPSAPNSGNGFITIQNGHTVTVTANVTVDQVVVNTGGQITLNGGVTLTMANGAGTDLSVSGYVLSAGTIRLNASATIAFNSGSMYQHNQNGGTIPTATWNASSTCLVTGTVATLPTGLNQTFGHFTWNCTGQSTTNTLANVLTIAGNLTIQSTGSTGQFRCATGTSTVSGNYVQSGGTVRVGGGGGGARIVSVGGNFSMSGGTLNLSTGSTIGILNVAGDFSHTAGTIDETGTVYGAIVFNGSGTQTYTSGGVVSNAIDFTVSSGATVQLLSGSTVIAGGGTFTLSNRATLGITSTAGITLSGASGNIQVTGTRTYSTSANYIYNGTSAQSTGNGLPYSVNDLTINNSSGINLTANVTVNGMLMLLSGNIVTSANRVITSSTGNVSRTSGHIDGTLQKNVATGADVNRTFEIGTGSVYAPLSITFASVTTAGNLTGFSTASDHPNISSSGLNGSQSVNRYWTLTNSGIVFTTYDATFNFVVADVDIGANPAGFLVGQQNASTWSLPAIGTRTSTSTQATSLTSFNNFAVGDGIPDTISASAGANGGISPSGTVLVNQGSDQLFTVTPNTGYHVDSLFVDGVNQGQLTMYTFTNVLTNHSIRAVFAINQYTITASAGTNGSILPSGSVIVNHASVQGFTITPSTGYHVDSLFVDGVDQGQVASYTFTNVVANHTIRVVFAINQYTIAASAGTNGSINPTGAVVVNHGSFQAFTITSDTGHHVDSLIVDGTNLGTLTSYTFTNITSDHTIRAVFAINQYIITASAGANGAIDPNGALRVADGADQSFNITANSGYQIESVVVDGADRGPLTSYTFTNVTANHAISATFSQLPNPVPGLTAITPDTSAYRGQTLDVNLEGRYFLNGVTSVDVGSGITVNTMSIVVDSIIFLNITVSPTAAHGARSVTVANSAPGGGVSNAKSFVVLNRQPTAARLLVPVKADTLVTNLLGTNVDFRWLSSSDLDVQDTVRYSISVNGPGLDTMVSSLTDTSVSLGIAAFLQDSGSYRWTVNTADGYTTTVSPDTFIFYVKTSTGVDNQGRGIPDVYALHQNYPNPFNPMTSIRFDLPHVSDVRIVVYNIIGQDVMTLVDEAAMVTGYQEIRFDASDIPSGVYFYSITAREGNGRIFTSVKRMLLVK